jgi:nucleotide-binding universal stress UspA family protein
MRRILVPLDGTGRAASILPDAIRLAGPCGSLVLIRDAEDRTVDIDRDTGGQYTEIELAEMYLAGIAEDLRKEGHTVLSEVFVMGGPNAAIEEAIRLFQPDMVACATHARSGISRLFYGSVAWAALSHSPVPMLLRHAGGNATLPEPEPRRILVPLDGSELAEAALPLAEELALEWGADLCLARAVPWNAGLYVAGHARDAREAHAYLEDIVAQREAGLAGNERSVREFVLSGAPVDALGSLVEDKGITDVVMASHGRTGLARLAVGSVAHGLIHRVQCPLIVVPVLAAHGAKAERAPASAMQ